MGPLAAILVFLTCLASGSVAQEDGFTFDLAEEVDLVEPSTFKLDNHYQAYIGKVFHLPLPLESSQGLKARQDNIKVLPHWLIFNKKTATFYGIPLPGDEGVLHITITPLNGVTSQRITLVVKDNEDDETSIETCKLNEDRTILALLLDRNIRSIKPKQRVVAVNNIAKFFKLPYTAFTLKPQSSKDDITDSSVVLAGPGNILSRSSRTSSYLEIPVGCDGRLWESTAPLVRNLRQQARDGTIEEILGLPLYGWRVKTETKPVVRSKRQAAVDDYGSGDYDDAYFDEYEDEEYDGEDLDEITGPASKKPEIPGETPSTKKTTSTSTTTMATSTHPHRHHHGESKQDEEELNPEVVRGETFTTTIKSPGPTKIDIPKPSEEYGEYDYDAYDEDPVESATIVPDVTKKTSTESRFTTTEWQSPKILEEEDYGIEEETEVAVPAASSTTLLPSSTPSTTSTTTTRQYSTTVEIVDDTEPPTYTIMFTETSTPSTTQIPSTSTASTTTSTTTTTPATTTTATSTTTEAFEEKLTTTGQETSSSTRYITPEEERTTKVTTPRQTTTEEVFVSETVEPINRFLPEPRNTKPYIEKRLQYQAVTAGKVFRYIIPFNSFKDAEDGYNLTLQVFNANEQPIPKNSWLQYNPTRKELYGLPLAEDVSNWVYVIRATDKQGAYEQDQLTIQVQQHRLERVMSHEFIMHLRIEKPQEYPHYVDWSLKVLRALGRICQTNMTEITVRYIDYSSDPVIFAWANDSLPTSYCPRTEIDDIFKSLTANDRGDPSRELSTMLAPDLRVKRIVNKDLSICEQQPAVVAATPSTNFSPILRNPVDKVNATLGELLVYKVKDDTFYDPEDVDPSTLNITLLTSDLTALPPTSWLQFDSKNREFYGIPNKTGRTEYFLLCVDTGGMSAKDSLEVVVHPSVKKQYNVEFSMSIGVPFETFSQNPSMQRKFVEKLMEVFEEPSPSNFHFLPFKPKRESNFDSTAVYWFNKSLPVDTCPLKEIERLEQLLHSDTRSISSRVHRIMGPEFRVSTIKVHHIGNCRTRVVVEPTPEVKTRDEEAPPPTAQNDVLITLVLPIVIIAIMLFIAAIAACILYRKRRMGKMNVEEDGRQSYGNKGIPVIFQEELEEKPEPGTKAPVILKDEKPPLAPPEYSRSGSVKLEDSEPYQPPPPFARAQDNGRVRPKPTPTYRKPPPYVPP